MGKIVNIRNVILLIMISMFSIGMVSLAEQTNSQETSPYQYEDSTRIESSELTKQQLSKSTNKTIPINISSPVANIITYPTPGGNDGVVEFLGSWEMTNPSTITKVDLFVPRSASLDYGNSWWKTNLDPDKKSFTVTATGLSNQVYTGLYYDIHYNVSSKVSSSSTDFTLPLRHSPPYDLQDPIVTVLKEPYPGEKNGILEIKGSWKFDHADPVEKVDVTIGGQWGPWIQDVDLDPGNKSFTLVLSNVPALSYAIRYDIHHTKIDGSAGDRPPNDQVNSNITVLTVNDTPRYEEAYDPTAPTAITITQPVLPGEATGEIEIKGNWKYDYNDPIEYVDLFINGVKYTLNLGDLDIDHKSFTYLATGLIADTYDIYYDVWFKPKTGTTNLKITSPTKSYVLESILNLHPPESLTVPTVTTTVPPTTSVDTGTIEVKGSWEYLDDDPIEGVTVWVGAIEHQLSLTDLGPNHKSFTCLIPNVPVGTYIIEYDVIYRDLDNTTILTKKSSDVSHTVTSTHSFDPPYSLTIPTVTTIIPPTTSVDTGTIEVKGSWKYSNDDPIEGVTVWVGGNEHHLSLIDLEPDHKSFTYLIPNVPVGTYLIDYEVNYKDFDNITSLTKRSSDMSYTVTSTHSFDPPHSLTNPIVTTTIHPDTNMETGTIEVSGSWEYSNDDPIEGVTVQVGALEHYLSLEELEPDHKSFTCLVPNIPVGSYLVSYEVNYKDLDNITSLTKRSSDNIHTVRRDEKLYATFQNIVIEKYVLDVQSGSISFDYEITNPDNITTIEKVEINLIDINDSSNNKTIALDPQGSNWKESVRLDFRVGEYQLEATSTFTTSQGIKRENLTLQIVGNIVITEKNVLPDLKEASFVAWIIVGVLSFLLLIILIMYYIYRRHKQEETPEALEL